MPGPSPGMTKECATASSIPCPGTPETMQIPVATGIFRRACYVEPDSLGLDPAIQRSSLGPPTARRRGGGTDGSPGQAGDDNKQRFDFSEFRSLALPALLQHFLIELVE